MKGQEEDEGAPMPPLLPRGRGGEKGSICSAPCTRWCGDSCGSEEGLKTRGPGECRTHVYVNFVSYVRSYVQNAPPPKTYSSSKDFGHHQTGAQSRILL